MKTNSSLPHSPAANESGLNTPSNGKYHDQSTLTRCLAVASAGKKLWAAAQRVPHFYPAEWPLGSVTLYVALIGAGIYSSTILSLLTSLSGNPLLAIAAPVLIAVLEFIVVPGVKYHSLRDKQIALMKAYVAEDRAARDAATHAATAWNFKDWLVLATLALCLAAKAVVLIHFGAYQPQALLATNWTIALLDFSFHLAGTTTRVPCFVGSRLTDALHLRRRRSLGYETMGKDGKPELGSLAFREFPFSTVIPIRNGEVDGHVIVHTGSDDVGHHYVLYSPGTLDDSDRAAFLNRQPNHLAQTELARALARVQLEQLTAPEMRSLHPHELLAMPPVVPATNASSIEAPPTTRAQNGNSETASSAAVRAAVVSISSIIIALLLPSCVDRSAMASGNDNESTPVIVITQPAKSDAIRPVVDTLRECFTRVAQASMGAHVPKPHLSILLADGRTVEVPVPEVGDALFGEASPKARKERLEGHLTALAEKLSTGCSGQVVPGKVVKDISTVAFKDGDYTVWAAGGGASLWSPKDSAPAAFIEDRESFVQLLANSSSSTGHLLILTDGTGTNLPKLKPAKPVAAAKPKPIAPVTAEDRKPTADSIGVPSAPAPLTGGSPVPPLAQSTPPRPGDNISINVTYPETKAVTRPDAPPASTQAEVPTSQAAPQLAAVKLPDGVEALGDPILFAPGSAKLTSQGHETISNAAATLKATGGRQHARIFLVGKADHTLDEASNRMLSQQRADSVSAALLELGIAVEQTFAIGESNSPDGTPRVERAKYRSVQVYVLRSPNSQETPKSGVNSLTSQAG